MKRLSEQYHFYNHLTFFTAFSLPRARAVKTPSAAKTAQASRAAWKLFTNVCCSPLMLVGGRLCAFGDDWSVPAVTPPRAAKTVPVKATLMLCPMKHPEANNPYASP